MKNINLKLSLPIGVFDSGIGGLTVLRELQQVLPEESYIYLGDTARLPYGTKSRETVIRYAKQTARILISRGIKLLVIACNTATALALAALQETYPKVPIIGVIEPGAKAACEASKNGHIAVIATEATVSAGGYQRAIQKIRPEAQVITKGCSLFVSLAEEGWVDGTIADAVAQRYLAPIFPDGATQKPDCLVLGCTHFPVLLEPIKKIIGDDVVIIDSAKTTAQLVEQMLDKMQIRKLSSATRTQFLVTDAPERFARVAPYFLNSTLNAKDVELVDFISSPVLNR